MTQAEMDFHFRESFSETPIPESYERLLLDALSGDASLFARNDEIELAWNLVDSIREGWEGECAPPLENYPCNSWGPPGSDRLIWGSGRWWVYDCAGHHHHSTIAGKP